MNSRNKINFIELEKYIKEEYVTDEKRISIYDNLKFYFEDLIEYKNELNEEIIYSRNDDEIEYEELERMIEETKLEIKEINSELNKINNIYSLLEKNRIDYL